MLLLIKKINTVFLLDILKTYGFILTELHVCSKKIPKSVV